MKNAFRWVGGWRVRFLKNHLRDLNNISEGKVDPSVEVFNHLESLNKEHDKVVTKIKTLARTLR